VSAGVIPPTRPDALYGELRAPCRCVYPDKCFCTSEQKATPSANLLVLAAFKAKQKVFLVEPETPSAFMGLSDHAAPAPSNSTPRFGLGMNAEAA
jgi:hypothetical protein